MARGNGIIVSANPRGVFSEGTLTAITPKPGTIMQIDASAGISTADGKFTFELYNADADGGRPKGPLYILLEDSLQGKLATDAYVASTRCFLYTPCAGEEFNMLLGDVAGTGDDHALGEMLMVDDSTGKLVATTGTPETEPFMNLEASTDPTADALHHVIYTGY